MARVLHAKRGMLPLAADSRGITIPNKATRGWPAWLWPTGLFVPLYLFFAVLYWLMWPAGSPEWTWTWAWLWAAYAVLLPLAAWLASIAAFEVDPTQMRVRRHLRSQRAPLNDVLRIDVRKMPWSFASRFRPAPYAIDVWLAGYRHWRLQYVEPEAGDRLLAVLHGYQKPIWVVRTA